MFGYTEKELVFTNIAKLLHPDELRSILRRRESPSLWAAPDAERQMVRKDGAVLAVEGLGRVIHKNKQMVVLRDLAKIRQAEELVKETKQRMLDILDSISDSFIVLDDEWRFKFINKRAAALLGLSLENILGTSIWERFPRLLGTPFEANYRAAMRDRAPVLFEAETPEGRWTEVRVYPTTEGLTIYGTDVTARKRAEERLRFAVESAPMMIVEWTDENGQRKLAPEGENKPKVTVERGSWASLDAVHPDDRARVAEERARAAERGGDSTIELRLVRPDGSISWVSDRVRVTHAQSGKVTRIMDVFIDITEHKRLEEEVRALRERLGDDR